MPAPGEPVLAKRRFSAFFATHLDLLLRRLGTQRLVVCGVQARGMACAGWGAGRPAGAAARALEGGGAHTPDS